MVRGIVTEEIIPVCWTLLSEVAPPPPRPRISVDRFQSQDVCSISMLLLYSPTGSHRVMFGCLYTIILALVFLVSSHPILGSILTHTISLVE